MAKDTRILVDLQRCTGCWTCSMACKVINGLPDEDFWITVRTLGSGEGIDRPAGTWPDLHMSWMPVWSKQCVKCAPYLAEGHDEPFCVKCCPNKALTYGEDVDAEVQALREKDFRISTLSGLGELPRRHRVCDQGIAIGCGGVAPRSCKPSFIRSAPLSGALLCVCVAENA